MASVKDMLFQLTELKRDNDDLKEQNMLLVAQQTQMLQQQAWTSQQVNWFQQQLKETQAQFGDCYYQYSLCSLELYNLKNTSVLPQGPQVLLERPQEAINQLPQEPIEQLLQQPIEQLSQQQNKQREEWEQMLLADVESHQLDKQLRVQHSQRQDTKLRGLAQQVQVQESQRETLVNQVRTLKQQFQDVNTELGQTKTQVQTLESQLLELSTCLEQASKDLQQKGNQLSHARKQLKEEQDKLKQKTKESRNQQDTIHGLQNNLVKVTGQLADAESFVKTAKSDVALATDLSNGLSTKCLRLQEEHKTEVDKLTEKVDALKQQLEGQRISNVKLVQRAVEQQKQIKKLSKVSVVFQADPETTESVIKESYTDLQRFIEDKALHMERLVALLAYAIIHVKYVLERFVLEQFEEKTPDNILHKEFLNQIVNHLTRVFMLVPVSIMTRNIDRLTDHAAAEKINIRSLHVIQYMLPITAEEARASRQRVVLENFPHLNKFFIEDHCTDNDSISMSVQGFMMLLGISK